MTEPANHWLEHVDEVAASIRVVHPDEPAPLTFFLGAGASLSSGGPKTAEILRECRRKWPAKFPSDDAVYERFGTRLTAGERDGVMEPLFKDIEPYAGYRCLAATARSRPVFVVNLNWDSSVTLAAERVGVPAVAFDLKDVAAGREAIAAARERKCGIVSVHVHGFLDNPDKTHGIRFARPDTQSFEREEVELLRELLAPATIVAGTSLVGPRDVHEMLKALLPLEAAAGGDSGEPLWVFERGPHRPASRVVSEVAVGLSKALLARNSIDNFITNPDVDFDTMLAALRGAEVDLPWAAMIAAAVDIDLPKLEELVPPNPQEVRPLLDEQRSLIVGAPQVGTSTLAYLVAWWHCLTARREVPQLVGLQGPAHLLSHSASEGAGEEVREAEILVVDNLFDEQDLGEDRTDSLPDRLAGAITGLGDRRIVATASPDGTVAAVCRPSHPFQCILSQTVVQAGTLWRPNDLRAWARARGGDRAEVVCREVRMGMVTTPSQAVRTLKNHQPHELEAPWNKQLRDHLKTTYKPSTRRALLLAMLRLQDFSVPRNVGLLARLAGTQVEKVSRDPWGLCTPIEVDGERYLRLSHPGVVQAVDEWLEEGCEELSAKLYKGGESTYWARTALESWKVFRRIDHSLEVPGDFGAVNLELFGAEFVRRAMQREPVLALKALWSTWKLARSHWTAKDVALDLVMHWEALEEASATEDLLEPLLESLLEADREFGAYALFEALLRVGRPVPIELWTRVTGKILSLARSTNEDPIARRQVALSFDALLWRPCPVSQEQHRKLVDKLLKAGRRDQVLKAAFAAACSYHFRGYRRLSVVEGFDPPLAAGDGLSLAQAREMAWLVAWHFVHQSRCRAVVSRRTFQSTVETVDRVDDPRYLDRYRRQDPLDAEHETAILHFAEALLEHRETAGWALHLIMNIHSTTGSFDVPDALIARFGEALKNDAPDPAVVSAALTYMPAEDIRKLLAPILKRDEGREELQRGLGQGVPIEPTVDGETTWVVEPHFAMSGDPWAARKRWKAAPRKLPFGRSSVRELIEKLDASVDDAVEEGLVDRGSAERALATLRRGDTRPMELSTRDRNLEHDNYPALLKFVCDYFEAAGNAR